MNRLSFIRSLAAAAAGHFLPGQRLHIAKSYRKIYLLQCFVAGFQFTDGPERLPGMAEGDLLDLRREPDNPEDDRAIALLHNGRKIGYVPRRENKMLSRLLDADAVSLVAEITHLKKEAADWEKVCIAIYILKEIHGPVPAQAAYLTELEKPHYTSVRGKKRQRSGEDWHDVLVGQSKTDHIYDLIYNNVYPTFGGPNHDGDFVVIRKSRMPAYFRDIYADDVACYLPDIKPGLGENDYMAMRSDRLSNYLEAARKMKEVYDEAGKNYLELHFVTEAAPTGLPG